MRAGFALPDIGLGKSNQPGLNVQVGNVSFTSKLPLTKPLPGGERLYVFILLP
jgi:hypothetical protein